METVAILIPTLKKGGAEKQAVLLKNVFSLNYRVLFILFNAELGWEQELIELGKFDDTNLIKIQGGLIKKLLELRKVLRKNNVKYLFTYLTAPNLYGSLVGRLSGVKGIYTGLRNADLEPYKLRLEKIAGKLATKVISNNYMGEIYLNQNGLKKTCTIPNCYINFHEIAAKEEKELVYIVTVARFTDQKDYLTALKSVRQLCDEMLKVHFTIIGYGVLEGQIREWVKELQLDDVVSIVINPNNVFGYLEKQDIYLSTSLYEGTSNSIMEALDAELPVVATDVGDNKYLVIDGKNGFIHKTGDVKEISKSLKKLVLSSEMRRAFGKRGKNLLRANHSIEQFKQSYIGLLK